MAKKVIGTPARGMGSIMPGRALPQFGFISKGAPQQETVDGRTGKAQTFMGPELPYFRLILDETRPFLTAWAARLPKEPQEIPFVFSYSELERNLEIDNRCYKGDVLIHRCDALSEPDENGTVPLFYALHPQTLQPTVINGTWVETGLPARCGGETVYSTDKYEYHCTFRYRLHIVPRGVGESGILTLRSGSKRDGRTLRGQLLTLLNELSADVNHPDLRGIPLVLKRVKLPYSWYDNGVRKEGERWFVTIEIDPVYGRAVIAKQVRTTFEALAASSIDDVPELESADDEGYDVSGNGDQTVDSKAIVQAVVSPKVGLPQPKSEPIKAEQPKPEPEREFVPSADEELEETKPRTIEFNGKHIPAEARVSDDVVRWFNKKYVGDFNQDGDLDDVGKFHPSHLTKHLMKHFGKEVTKIAYLTNEQLVALVKYVWTRPMTLKEGGKLTLPWYSDKIKEAVGDPPEDVSVVGAKSIPYDNGTGDEPKTAQQVAVTLKELYDTWMAVFPGNNPNIEKVISLKYNTAVGDLTPEQMSELAQLVKAVTEELVTIENEHDAVRELSL